MLLARLDRKQEALALLERASKASPQEPDPALAKATLLGLMDRHAEAERAVKTVAARWPEFGRAFLVRALLLERSGRTREAQCMLDTAALLGADELAVRCGPALLAGQMHEGCSLPVRTFPWCSLETSVTRGLG